jgi:hypothetical protein
MKNKTTESDEGKIGLLNIRIVFEFLYRHKYSFVGWKLAIGYDFVNS